MPITNAIISYQDTKCETSFALLYHHIYGKGNSIIKTFSSRYKLDEHDVESMINEKILDITEKYEGSSDKFRNAVFQAIKFGCIDLARKRNRKESHHTEVMQEDDEGRLNEIYEVKEVAPTTEENSFIEGIQKKYDQRQLIAFLTSKADNKILTSASAFIELDSYRKAAKLLGTTDKTVKSRVRSLSKQFDENRFGNYYDYFTTATIHVG